MNHLWPAERKININLIDCVHWNFLHTSGENNLLSYTKFQK